MTISIDQLYSVYSQLARLKNPARQLLNWEASFNDTLSAINYRTQEGDKGSYEYEVYTFLKRLNAFGTSLDPYVQKENAAASPTFTSPSSVQLASLNSELKSLLLDSEKIIDYLRHDEQDILDEAAETYAHAVDISYQQALEEYHTLMESLQHLGTDVNPAVLPDQPVQFEPRQIYGFFSRMEPLLRARADDLTTWSAMGSDLKSKLSDFLDIVPALITNRPIPDEKSGQTLRVGHFQQKIKFLLSAISSCSEYDSAQMKYITTLPAPAVLHSMNIELESIMRMVNEVHASLQDNQKSILLAARRKYHTSLNEIALKHLLEQNLDLRRRIEDINSARQRHRLLAELNMFAQQNQPATAVTEDDQHGLTCNP